MKEDGCKFGTETERFTEIYRVGNRNNRLDTKKQFLTSETHIVTTLSNPNQLQTHITTPRFHKHISIPYNTKQ